MKTLAKYHVCNHCVIGKKKHLKIYLLGPVSYCVFQEMASRGINKRPTACMSNRMLVFFFPKKYHQIPGLIVNTPFIVVFYF